MEWLCLTLLAWRDTQMLFNWLHFYFLITKESFKVRLDWKTKGHHKKGQKKASKTCLLVLDQKEICTHVQQVFTMWLVASLMSSSFKAWGQNVKGLPNSLDATFKPLRQLLLQKAPLMQEWILHKHKVFSLLVFFLLQCSTIQFKNLDFFCLNI